MLGAASCTRRRAVSNMTTEEDEIQLVARAAANETDDEDEAGIFDLGLKDDQPPTMKLDMESGEESEPRVADEKHIKHPGKLRMRLRKLRSSRSKRWYWWTTLLCLTILIFVFVGFPLGLWADESKETCFDYESDDESSEQYPFLFLPNRGKFLLCEKGDTKLEGYLGKHHTYIKEERVNLYTYTPDTVLNITRINENCLRIEWNGVSSVEYPLVDCFIMRNDEFVGDLEWFGAHELFAQTWPLHDVHMNATPFLPQDYLASSFSQFQSQESFGSVLHPLWLSSNGVGILVDQTTPLSVSIEQGEKRGDLCLHAVPYALECIPNSFEVTTLKYTVCIHDSIAETAKYFLGNHIPHPKAVPARETFAQPVWSTQGVFTTEINDSVLQNYLTSIKNYGFNISQLQIDDGYGGEGGTYGNLSMAIDTKALASKFDVALTAWVHPFINPNADIFEDRIDEDYFLPGKSDIEGDSVSLVRWWHGHGAVVNILSERVAAAHHQALSQFMNDYDLTSLMFDAGEVTYLPKCVYTQNVDDPGAYTTAYAAFAGNFSEVVSSRAQVRVGYFSQEHPLWVRMLDRNSSWGEDGGLKSIVTTALTFGIAGYPFVVADMFTRNAFEPGTAVELDPELYVRWLQLNTFLPSMQLSLSLFHDTFKNYKDINITQHALELTRLHSSLAETFYNLSLTAVQSGSPVIRPLWWLDSSQESVLVDDQFLIGDDIMFAPILKKGLPACRCVYFPHNTQWTRCGHDTQWTRCDHGSKVYPDNCSDECQPEDCVGEHDCSFEVTLSEFLYFKRIYS